MKFMLKNNFEKFFLTESSAFELGFCRFIFYTFCAFHFIPQDFSVYAIVPDVMWDRVWLHVLIPAPIHWTALFKSCIAIWKISLIFSALGLFTRTAFAISFFGALYFIGLQADVNCFYRVGNLSIIIMGIFLLSEAHLGFSFDRFIRNKLNRSTPTLPARSYGWPIRMALFCMLTTFLAAAISKLKNSGLNFITTDQLYDYIFLANKMYDYNLNSLKIACNRFVLSHPSSLHYAAAFALGAEAIAIFAFFSKRAAPFIYSALALMQIGIVLTMYIDSFNLYFPLYLFAVPWRKLENQPRWLGAAIAFVLLSAYTLR
jgi:hypothetical protein